MPYQALHRKVNAPLPQKRGGHKHNRLSKAELVGTDICKPASEEPASQPTKKCTKGERNNLGPVGINAYDARRQLVIPYRLHGAAELAVLEPPDAEANYPEHSNAEGEVGPTVCKREAEHNRACNSRDTVRAAG